MYRPWHLSTLRYIFVKDTFLFTLHLMRALKTLQGKQRAITLRLLEACCFSGKQPWKWQCLKIMDTFRNKRHSITRDVSQQHSWAVMLRDQRNIKDWSPTEHAEHQQIQSNYQELSGHLTVISTSELQCFHVQHRTNWPDRAGIESSGIMDTQASCKLLYTWICITKYSLCHLGKPQALDYWCK